MLLDKDQSKSVASFHWEALRIIAVALLVALPVFGVLDYYEHADPGGFLVVTLVGICYGASYFLVFHSLLPRVQQLLDLRQATGTLAGLAAFVAAVGFGMLLTDFALAATGWQAEMHRLIGGAIVVVGRLLTLESERHQRRAREAELCRVRAEHEAARQRLAAIQARVDPHFLFNSLNVLTGVIEENPPRAVEMVERLSSLYRHALTASASECISLAQEIDAAVALLDIQALRFEGRIDYEVDVVPGLADRPVPALCLQPLVENAVLHGGSHGACHIRITADAHEGSLRLTVDDDGPGPGRSAHRGAGTGLKDLSSRLALDPVWKGRVKLSQRPGGGCRAELILPPNNEG